MSIDPPAGGGFVRARSTHGYTPAMAPMTTTAAEGEQLMADWPARAAAVVEQIAAWSAAEGWRVDRGTDGLDDRRFGTYEGAALVLHPPEGEVAVTPVGPTFMGRAGGWVDIDVRPTMSRVRLWGRSGDWEIIVGGNIPMRRPWTRATFAQLVTDMLS